ncbi:hypothetical protein BC628DRAFT_1073325 [Trametes gibbosa]|nr:hypothetical protein BC628DRAFT_1073325 [Trametes gibbosa]
MTEPNVRSPFDDADADIILRSADQIDFRLYKVILRKASTVIRDMLTLPDVNVDKGEPQVVEVTEDADTLDRLLRFCYPVPRPVFKTLDEVLPVLDAAQKYEILVVAADARCVLEELSQNEPPTRVYAIACRYEFPALARKAARLLVKEADPMGLPALPPDIAALPVESQLALARYRSLCRQAVMDELTRNHEWLREGDHSYRVYFSRKGNVSLDNTWVWYRCTTCPKNYCSPLSVCTWWVTYDAMCTAALLKDGLDGSVVAKENILNAASLRVPTCETCTPNARAQLTIYALALEKRIEKAIDGVLLDLPFPKVLEA